MEKAIGRWREELVRAHQRMGDLFPRSEVRERSLAYLEGLLSYCERKNSWQVAEWAGEASPYGMQYLLDRARWDANAVQARLSEYIKEELGSRDAVLVLDETGFLKKEEYGSFILFIWIAALIRVPRVNVLCLAWLIGDICLCRFDWAESAKELAIERPLRG